MKTMKNKKEIGHPPSCENCQYKTSMLLCVFVKELNTCVLRLPRKWEEYFFLDGSVKPLVIFEENNLSASLT